MTKRMLTMLLAAVILLSANGCAPAPDTAENSSSSSVTTEELQVLQDENEKLKQELAELKGEKQDAEVEGEEPEAEGSTTSEPAAKPTAPAEKPAAPAANNQAAKPQAEKPAANNTQTAAKPQTPAPQKTSTGKGPLAKYTVNVNDSSTPAVKVVGETLNGKSAYYFYSDDDDLLGNIPMNILTTIIRENDLSYAEADEQKSWFVENFNIYRGLDGGSYEGGSSNSGSSSSSKVDIEKYRDEVFRLVNKAREKEGIEPVVSDPTAMEYAQIRAEELAEKFSHTRPNGDDGTIYSHYSFAENIAMRQKSPERVVDAWMNSSGHRATMLADYSDYGNCMGVGVYEENGTLYWVLEFIGWDSEA